MAELRARLATLRTNAAALRNVAELEREMRKRRMAESRRNREATKQRLLGERAAAKRAETQVKKQAELRYLGPGVSAGLGPIDRAPSTGVRLRRSAVSRHCRSRRPYRGGARRGGGDAAGSAALPRVRARGLDDDPLPPLHHPQALGRRAPDLGAARAAQEAAALDPEARARAARARRAGARVSRGSFHRDQRAPAPPRRDRGERRPARLLPDRDVQAGEGAVPPHRLRRGSRNRARPSVHRARHRRGRARRRALLRRTRAAAAAAGRADQPGDHERAVPAARQPHRRLGAQARLHVHALRRRPDAVDQGRRRRHRRLPGVPAQGRRRGVLRGPPRQDPRRPPRPPPGGHRRRRQREARRRARRAAPVPRAAVPDREGRPGRQALGRERRRAGLGARLRELRRDGRPAARRGAAPARDRAARQAPARDAPSWPYWIVEVAGRRHAHRHRDLLRRRLRAHRRR